MSSSYPLFVRRDLDGFFGLFVDNLMQLLLILTLCTFLCGMSGESAYLLFKHILPGAAVSILLGNLFYAWQARRLALKEGRDDVTALPYGINTPSLLIYVFFVMNPVFTRALSEGHTADQAAVLAWEMGLVACVGSGLTEFFGAFIAESVRRRTPRAALLSTLAGIAIGYISMGFTMQIFQKPIIAMMPLAIVLITYFAQIPFPWHLPGGMIAVLLGTAIAWLITGLTSVWPDAPAQLQESTMNVGAIQAAIQKLGIYVPEFVGGRIIRLLADPSKWIGFLSVIVPMGLFNLIGSLQNIESAEAGGDKFSTRSSLAANGIGTLSAAFFGSCFPTTIYIGHPGWKALGARAGYSTINGLVVTLICLTGTVELINAVIPMESGIAIVLWIGIIITAQAFSAVPREHAPAVAVGLFPAIAAWGFTVTQGAFFKSGGKTLQTLFVEDPRANVSDFVLHGMISMQQGYIFTCMILAAISAFLIDRRFTAAGTWSLIGALCAAVGLTHAYQLSGNVVDFLFCISQPTLADARVYRSWDMAIGYLLMAGTFFAFGAYARRKGELERIAH
ncbi:permease [Schlesneria paludicola]|uniref:permease n=1 Tax=Schlesneria paludicola TaxID=360056 RepID=UPI00029ADDC1|nr:permease [Schlesneria paludicola]